MLVSYICVYVISLNLMQDFTLEDKAIDPEVTSRIWYTHGNRAWRKQKPYWSLQDRPAQANSYDLLHRIDPKFI